MHPFKNAEILFFENNEGTYHTVTVNFENKENKEILLFVGYVTTNPAQYFLYDLVHDFKRNVKSISETDTSITIVTGSTSNSNVSYLVWIVLA